MLLQYTLQLPMLCYTLLNPQLQSLSCWLLVALKLGFDALILASPRKIHAPHLTDRFHLPTSIQAHTSTKILDTANQNSSFSRLLLLAAGMQISIAAISKRLYTRQTCSFPKLQSHRIPALQMMNPSRIWTQDCLLARFFMRSLSEDICPNCRAVRHSSEVKSMQRKESLKLILPW